MYKMLTKIKGESELDGVIARMMPLLPNPNYKFQKMTSLVSSLMENSDEFSIFEMKTAVKKRQDAQSTFVRLFGQNFLFNIIQ